MAVPLLGILGGKAFPACPALTGFVALRVRPEGLTYDSCDASRKTIRDAQGAPPALGRATREKSRSLPTWSESSIATLGMTEGRVRGHSMPACRRRAVPLQTMTAIEIAH